MANFLGTLYFVFYLLGGLRPPYRYGTKYNVARKLAKRNGAIIYAKAGRIYPTLYLALLFLILQVEMGGAWGSTSESEAVVHQAAVG